MVSNAPTEPSRHLYVSASVAGHKITVAKKNLEFDEVDPCLFDEDYTIAGSTVRARMVKVGEGVCLWAILPL